MTVKKPASQPASEIILYQTEDNQTRLEVRLEGETVWLTQAQMAELFQTTVPDVSMHIRNLFNERELERGSVVKEFLTTAADGKNYTTNRIKKLDDFLRLSDREILNHAGKVSHEVALAKAEAEYEKFRLIEAAKPSAVEKAFESAVQSVKQLEAGKAGRKKRTPKQ